MHSILPSMVQVFVVPVRRTFKSIILQMKYRHPFFAHSPWIVVDRLVAWHMEYLWMRKTFVGPRTMSQNCLEYHHFSFWQAAALWPVLLPSLPTTPQRPKRSIRSYTATWFKFNWNAWIGDSLYIPTAFSNLIRLNWNHWVYQRVQ